MTYFVLFAALLAAPEGLPAPRLVQTHDSQGVALPADAIQRFGNGRGILPIGETCQISPNGRWLRLDDGVYDLQTRTVAKPKGMPAFARAVGFAGDSTWIINDPGVELPEGTSSSSHRLFDPIAGKADRPFQAFSFLLYTADFRSDASGRRLLVINDHGSGIGILRDLSSIDLKAAKPRFRMWAAKKPVQDAAVSPDGRWIAWADEKANAIHVIDAKANKRHATWKLGEGKFHGGGMPGDSVLAFGRDGTTLAFLHGTLLQVREVATGKALHTTANPADAGSRIGTSGGFAIVRRTEADVFLVFDPGEVLSSPEYQLFGLDGRTGKTEKITVRLPGVIRAWTVLPDGPCRVVCHNGIVVDVDPKSGKVHDGEKRLPAMAGVAAIDNATAASWNADGRVFRWEIDSGKLLSEVKLPASNLGRDGVTFDARFRFIAAKANDAKDGFQVLDASTGKTRWNFPFQVNSADFAADGKSLAVAFWDIPARKNRVVLVDTSDFTFVELPYRQPKLKCCVRLSPDGRFLALGGGESTTAGELDLYDVQAGKHAWVAGLPKDGLAEVQGMAFDPKRELLFVRTDGKALAYSLANGLELRFQEIFHAVPSAYSSAGGMLTPSLEILGSEGEHFIRFGQFERGAALRSGQGKAGDRSIGFIDGLSFTPDGRRLLSAHDNGTCLVWDSFPALYEASRNFQFRTDPNE